MSLTGMYAYAQKIAQGKFHGTIQEQNGKLVFNGTVATENEKNEIWNAIKTIPTWRDDVMADIRVAGGPAPAASAPAAAPAPAPAAAKTYTVQAGDTLYAIAFNHGVDYRDLAQWNGIAAPYRIYVGQELRLDAPPVVASAQPVPGNAVVAPVRDRPGADRRSSRSRPPCRGRDATVRRSAHSHDRTAGAG